jgi:hypothetical protein
LENGTENTIANNGGIPTVEQELYGSVTDGNVSSMHQSPSDAYDYNQLDRKPNAMRVACGSDINITQIHHHHRQDQNN